MDGWTNVWMEDKERHVTSRHVVFLPSGKGKRGNKDKAGKQESGRLVSGLGVFFFDLGLVNKFNDSQSYFILYLEGVCFVFCLLS